MGLGRRIFPSGRIAEGFFINGYLYGLSKEIYTNGEAYVGMLESYVKHGQGQYWQEDGSTFAGIWIRGYLFNREYITDLDSFVEDDEHLPYIHSNRNRVALKDSTKNTNDFQHGLDEIE